MHSISNNIKNCQLSIYLIKKFAAFKNFNKGRGGTLLKVFLAYILFLAICIVGYKEMPILIKYSLLGEDSFYSGLITNLFSSAVDFLVFSFVLYFLLAKHDRTEKVRLYKDNIDDSRFLFSDEAAFRNAANVKRLQVLGENSLDLSKCNLKNTKIKEIKLVDSKLMGACLDDTNFEKSIFLNVNFKGASAKNALMNNIIVKKGNFKNFDFSSSQMIGAKIIDTDFSKSNLGSANFKATIFLNCNFLDASMNDCNMERADLRGAINLTVNQLLQCKSIKYAYLEKNLESAMGGPVSLGRRRP